MLLISCPFNRTSPINSYRIICTLYYTMIIFTFMERTFRSGSDSIRISNMAFLFSCVLNKAPCLSPISSLILLGYHLNRTVVITLDTVHNKLIAHWKRQPFTPGLFGATLIIYNRISRLFHHESWPRNILKFEMFIKANL